MITVDIKADVKRVEKFFSNLKKDAVKKAAARAINDALITVRKDGAQEIKKAHKALKIGDIKANMKIHTAWVSHLYGKVTTNGRPLSLRLFSPSGGQQRTRRSKGARGQVSLSRTGRARPLTAVMGNTRKLVQYRGRKAFRVLAYGNEIFVRVNATGRKLRRFRGPSLPGVFRAQGEKFKAIALKRFAVAFPNRMKFEIEKAKA